MPEEPTTIPTQNDEGTPQNSEHDDFGDAFGEEPVIPAGEEQKTELSKETSEETPPDEESPKTERQLFDDQLAEESRQAAAPPEKKAEPPPAPVQATPPPEPIHAVRQIADDLPETAQFDGKTVNVREAFKAFDDETAAVIVSVAESRAKAIVEETLNRINQVGNDRIDQIQARLDREDAYRAISEEAGEDVHPLVEPNSVFQQWLATQSERMQWKANNGTVKEMGRIVKIYREDEAEKTKGQEAEKAKAEKKRKTDELHRHTLRAENGRFLPSDERGDPNDFDAGFNAPST